MNDSFLTQIRQTDTSLRSGMAAVQVALQHPKNLDELFRAALDISDADYFRACRILELLLADDLNPIQPYVKRFCAALADLRNETALRSMSKIAAALVKADANPHHAFSNTLGPAQRQQLKDAAWSWLLGDVKVATKVWAMRTLETFARKEPQVKSELLEVLAYGFPEHSAAYRSAARHVAKNLSKRIK